MAIRLVDVEVTEPLPAIQVDGYAGVWALIRSQGTPVGWARLEKVRGEISPEHLAVEIAEQVGKRLFRERVYRSLVEEGKFVSGFPLRSNPETTTEIPSALDRQPFISVIICTRDRTESLVKALESVAKIDYPRFEVIVVDNCPATDETRQLLAEYPHFRRVLEPLPGLDYARNTGIAEAKGEIVAFIDDDAEADPEWLRGLAEGFADGDVVCVTGLVVPAEMETRAQELFETSYGGFGRGFERRRFFDGESSRYDSYRGSRFGTGCNMAFRKEALKKIGGFNVAFDVGTATGGGGDMDMFHRLIREGYAIAYRPDAVVRHTHRARESELRRLLFNYGRSFSAVLTKWLIVEGKHRVTTLKYIVRWYLTWFVFRGMKSGFSLKRDKNMPLGLVAVEAFGALTGPWAYFKAKARARRLGGQQSAR